MIIELRQLSLQNGISEYNMLQELGADENRFTNEVNGMSIKQYRRWLINLGLTTIINCMPKS